MIRKKITALAVAAAMLFSMVSIADAEGAYYTIYNESFEDGMHHFTSGSAQKEITADGKDGSNALHIGACSDKSDIPMMELGRLDTTAVTYVNVAVKADEAPAEISLVAELSEITGTSLVRLESKRVTNNDWTEISAKMFTKFKTLTAPIKIGVIAKTDSGFSGVTIDDFIIQSDTPGMGEGSSVENVDNDGNYTIRSSFETDSFGKLTINDDAGWLYVSSEVPAHSGTKCLKICNRTESKATVMVYLNEIDYKSVVNVSCYVRNPIGDNSHNYSWQVKVPTPSGDQWLDMGAPATAEGNEWTLVSGSVDLSKYIVSGTPVIQIVATMWADGKNNYFDFYADDVLVKANTPGMFYDDTKEENIKLSDTDPNISETATKASATYKDVQEDIPAMKDVFKDYFKVGACIANYMQSDTSRYGRLLKKHFNSVVSNGLTQMCEILPKGANGGYRFGPVDDILDFASRNGLDVVGHCLIWDFGTNRMDRVFPDGIPDRDGVIDFMKNYITKVMRHCEGDGEADEYTKGYNTSKWHVDTWDVVNEAVQAIFDKNAGLKYSDNASWYSVVGEDYVDYAFKFAEDAGYDNIKLRFNDYGSPDHTQVEGVVDVVKNLKNNGRKIDVIGMQSHLRSDFSNLKDYRYMLDRYMSVVDELNVTELDVQAYTAQENKERSYMFENGLTKERENSQASLYARLFNLYREYKGVLTCVNFWSWADGYSYYNESGYLHNEYCGIFDRDFQAKPQYWAIVDPDRFYNEMLNEDTSKTMFKLDGVSVPNYERTDSFTAEDGTVYAEAKEFLDIMGAKNIILHGELCFMKNNTYYTLKINSKEASGAFKNVLLDHETIEKDGKVYLPAIQTADLLGYEPRYDERRNVIVFVPTGSSTILEKL